MNANELIRIPDITALVAAVPALLTFTPRESVVMIALDENSRVLVSGRTDIADPDIDTLVRFVRKSKSASAAVITFSTDARAAFDTRTQVCVALRLAGIAVVGMHVDEQIITRDDGVQYSAPSAEQIEAACRTFGREPVTSREERARTVAPIKDRRVRDCLSGLGATTPQPADAAIDLETLCVTQLSTGTITAEDAATYLRNMRDIAYRDAVLIALTNRPMPNHIEVLIDLARRAPRRYAAAAYSAAGIALYLRGDGMRARCALQHALDAAPRYPLALLIGVAVDAGVPPHAFRDLLRNI